MACEFHKTFSKCQEPRSYIVETPTGKTFRRNRINIRTLTDHPQQVPENMQLPDITAANNPMKTPADTPGDNEVSAVPASARKPTRTQFVHRKQFVDTT